MKNTVTHQQIIYHGEKLIQQQVASAHACAQQYREGKLTWLSTTNLIHERTMTILNTEHVLGSLGASSHVDGALHPKSSAAVAKLEALQTELREYMRANIHTAA